MSRAIHLSDLENSRRGVLYNKKRSNCPYCRCEWAENSTVDSSTKRITNIDIFFNGLTKLDKHFGDCHSELKDEQVRFLVYACNYVHDSGFNTLLENPEMRDIYNKRIQFLVDRIGPCILNDIKFFTPV